jgi:hypothetical protein
MGGVSELVLCGRLEGRQAADVSSDSEIWVMCQLGSAAVPLSVAAGQVADVEEAQVEPDRPRSGGQMLPFNLK